MKELNNAYEEYLKSCVVVTLNKETGVRSAIALETVKEKASDLFYPYA